MRTYIYLVRHAIPPFSLEHVRNPGLPEDMIRAIPVLKYI